MTSVLAILVPWLVLAGGLLGLATVLGLSTITSPILGLALILGLGYVALTCRYPALGMRAALFVVPFERLTSLFPPAVHGSFSPLSFITLPKLMLLAVTASWLGRALLTRDDTPVRTFFDGWAPRLVALFALTTVLSMPMARGLGGFIAYEVRLVSGMIFFFLVLNLTETREDLASTVRVIAASYFFVGLVGVFEAITRQHLLTVLGFPMPELPYTMTSERFRIAGPSGDPDFFAISIILGLIATLGAWRLARSRPARLLYLLMLVVFIFDIFATGSRGAALCLGLAMGFFWLGLEMRHKWLVAVLILAALGLGFGAYTLFFSDLTVSRYLGESGQKSLFYRWGWAKMCWEIVKDSPVFGIGTSNFKEVYHIYADPLVAREAQVGQNTYAQLAAENGLPCLAVYVAVYGRCGLAAWQARCRSRDRRFRHLALSLAAIILAFAIFAATLYTVASEINWMVFALGVVAWRLARDEEGAGGVA
ncbi:MAG: O-antigen ligase family protein [Thermodesulfobacteriota bacterium]